MAHTVYKQRVYKNKQGHVVRTEGVGSESCDCNQESDHTKVTDVVTV